MCEFACRPNFTSNLSRYDFFSPLSLFCGTNTADQIYYFFPGKILCFLLFFFTKLRPLLFQIFFFQTTFFCRKKLLFFFFPPVVLRGRKLREAIIRTPSNKKLLPNTLPPKKILSSNVARKRPQKKHSFQHLIVIIFCPKTICQIKF